MKAWYGFMVGIFLPVLSIPLFSQNSNNLTVESPDNTIQVTIQAHGGKVLYQIIKNGKTVISPSSVGMVFRGMPSFYDNLTIAGYKRSSLDTTWEQPWGEQR